MEILFTNFDFVELLFIPAYNLTNAKSFLGALIAASTKHADFEVF